MHGKIRNDDERSGKHRQPRDIQPQRRRVEAECREDRGAGHLDIKPVLAVDQRQIRHLVDDESFKPVVEYGKLSAREERKEKA